MGTDIHPKHPVMVVEDDLGQGLLLERWLKLEGFEIHRYSSAEDCLQGLKTVLPSAICLDLHLPGMTGLDLLRRIRETHPRTPVIFLTADTEVATVVRAMQAGAYDYLSKPIDRTKLKTTVHNAIEKHDLSMRLSVLEREVGGGGYSGLLGRSEPMQKLYRLLDRVAPSDITVLIHGESGTGKELVARALHNHSGRRDKPWVALNCAAIPESLQESELFGHEKGAFTGAERKRLGKFERAHLGTLFLDEVGELSLGAQSRLLRVIQERRLQRVGGDREIPVDLRLVAATHRDLAADVQAQRFREDLFYRLAVFEIEIPPLRDRRDDIPLLAQHFLAEAQTSIGGKPLGLHEETMGLLLRHDWPGNVRELQNAIQRSVVSSDGPEIRPRDLPKRVRGPVSGARLVPLTAQSSLSSAAPEANLASPDPEPTKSSSEESLLPRSNEVQAQATSAQKATTLAEIERAAIADAIRRTGGNLSEAGRQLGIGRTTLYRKVKKYGLGT